MTWNKTYALQKKSSDDDDVYCLGYNEYYSKPSSGDWTIVTVTSFVRAFCTIFWEFIQLMYAHQYLKYYDILRGLRPQS